MRHLRAFFFGWDSPDTVSSLVPRMARLGGGGGGTTVVQSAPRVTPAAAPAPSTARTPTQSVTDLLSSRRQNRRNNTVLTNVANDVGVAGGTGRRTILGIPIA